MTRNVSPTLAETVFASRAPHFPAPRLLTGLTALAVTVTLVLATAIPVNADRPTRACTMALSADHTISCTHP